MRLTRNVNILFLVLTIMLATACGKDKNQPSPKLTPNAPSRCLLLQDSVASGEVNKYFYNGEGKIIRIERSQQHDPKFETIEYDQDGRLLKNNFYSHSDDLYQYNLFEYNSNDQVVKVKVFRAQPGGSLPDGYVILNYGVSGKLVEKNYFGGHQNGPTNKFTFTYLTDGSIVERKYYNFFGNDSLRLWSIREYVFDNKINPYADLNLLSVPNTVQTEQPEVFRHNVVSMKKYDPSYTVAMVTNTAVYQYTADGYPLKAFYKEISGASSQQNEIIFSYTCQ